MFSLSCIHIVFKHFYWLPWIEISMSYRIGEVTTLGVMCFTWNTSCSRKIKILESVPIIINSPCANLVNCANWPKKKSCKPSSSEIIGLVCVKFEISVYVTYAFGLKAFFLFFNFCGDFEKMDFNVSEPLDRFVWGEKYGCIHYFVYLNYVTIDAVTHAFLF